MGHDTRARKHFWRAWTRAYSYEVQTHLVGPEESPRSCLRDGPWQYPDLGRVKEESALGSGGLSPHLPLASPANLKSLGKIPSGSKRFSPEMDTKSLARSKRAHSLHHSKKHHPSPKPKAPSGSSSHSASANGASGKQVPVKAPSRPKPKLPSNWDRYEEEGTDSGLAESSEVQVSDVPAPKSKGADYRHLIAEAQSQSQSASDDPCLDSFASLGDVLPGKIRCLIFRFSR